MFSKETLRPEEFNIRRNFEKHFSGHIGPPTGVMDRFILLGGVDEDQKMTVESQKRLL